MGCSASACQARYIDTLLKKAQFREKEQERIYERLQRKEADNDRETYAERRAVPPTPMCAHAFGADGSACTRSMQHAL